MIFKLNAVQQVLLCENIPGSNSSVVNIHTTGKFCSN